MRTGEIGHARQPAGQQRIVGQRRADADHDGVALGAQQMNALAGGFAGDCNRQPPRGAGLAVGRDRELEGHLGPTVAHAPNVAGEVVRAPLRADADVDRNAGRAQPRVAGAGHFGIGVFDRRDDAGDAGLDDCVGARRRFAEMRARLERDVKRRAARGVAGAPQRLDLGMRPPARLRPAAADHDAVLDDHRADGGIGPGTAKPAPPERQRQRHEAGVNVLDQGGPHDRSGGMNVALRRAMTVEEYLAWSERQSERQRTELINGQIVAMPSERVLHSRVKGRVHLALLQAVKAAGLPCEALPDGPTVRIDDHTAYEPDAMVYCGESPAPNSLQVSNPVIVVEVFSPTTAHSDTSAKLIGYFKVPTVAHYIISIQMSER